MPVVNGVFKPLPRAQVPRYFGEACDERNLTIVNLPILGRAQLHFRIAAAFVQVFELIVEHGQSKLIDKSDYGGTYNCRTVRNSKVQSPHSWGIAMDLNVTHFRRTDGSEYKDADRTNFKCTASEVAPSLNSLAPYFQMLGMTWGGTWNTYKDPMHMEATETTLRLLEGSQLSVEEQTAIATARSKVMTDISGWAVPFVARATEEGLMTVGVDGRFRGTEPATREELATVAVRVLDKFRQEARLTQPG
jgi:hypothetical protein